MDFLNSASSFFRRRNDRDSGHHELADAFQGLETELTALRAIVATLGAQSAIDPARVEEYVRASNSYIPGAPTETHVAEVMERVDAILKPRSDRS